MPAFPRLRQGQPAVLIRRSYRSGPKPGDGSSPQLARKDGRLWAVSEFSSSVAPGTNEQSNERLRRPAKTAYSNVAQDRRYDRLVGRTYKRAAG